MHLINSTSMHTAARLLARPRFVLGAFIFVSGATISLINVMNTIT